MTLGCIDVTTQLRNKSLDTGTHIENKKSRRGIHEETCGLIRDLILENQLGVESDRIDEMALAHQLGLSRTPVREALKVLAAEGLVEILPRRGSRVRRPTIDEIKDLFAVIASLERMAAEQITATADSNNLKKIRKLHDEMHAAFDAQNRSVYFHLNHLIHETIIELTGNAQLRRTHSELLARARRPRFIAITSNDRWGESMREHDLLMQTMELGQVLFAGQILFEHVLKTGSAYIENIEASP